jgi:DNA-binding winged helix-turn-helix (wHTH) protein
LQLFVAVTTRAQGPHGQVVTREELKQALWPSDTHVNFDANVNTTVNRLRQILGDSTDRPVYIETIPRKGYSFLFKPEFSTQPFPLAPPAVAIPEEAASAATSEDAATHSDRWLTFGVIALIVAGILFGAGLAAFWISRFAPHFPR